MIWSVWVFDKIQLIWNKSIITWWRIAALINYHSIKNSDLSCLARLSLLSISSVPSGGRFSSLFEHPTHSQRGLHVRPPLWHSQYFFKHLLFLQRHPLLVTSGNSSFLIIYRWMSFSSVLWQSSQEQRPGWQTSPILRQSQYPFSHLDCRQLQPLRLESIGLKGTLDWMEDSSIFI